MLDGITELCHQVEQILATLTEEDDASATEWFWLRMTDRVRGERFAELSAWIETVLRTQYPDYLADQIRPCWPNHPEARWELAWLYQQWSLTYLTRRTTSKDAAEWHDRRTRSSSRRARNSHLVSLTRTRCPTIRCSTGLLDDYVVKDMGAAALVAAGYDPDLVERVIRMVGASGYKRRQYPPGPKITPKNFGRDRRLPITNRWREHRPAT